MKNLDDHIREQLSGFKLEWEGGEASSLIHAFDLCAGNDYPFPQWLKAAVKDDLQFAYHNRRRGHAMQRTAGVADRWREIHLTRHGIMKGFLKLQHLDALESGEEVEENKAAAARETAAALKARNDDDKPTVTAVLQSFDAIERELNGGESTA